MMTGPCGEADVGLFDGGMPFHEVRRDLTEGAVPSDEESPDRIDGDRPTSAVVPHRLNGSVPTGEDKFAPYQWGQHPKSTDMSMWGPILYKAPAASLLHSRSLYAQTISAARRYQRGETKSKGAVQLFYALSTPMESETNRRTAQVL